MPKKRFLVPALLLTVCLSVLAGCGAISLIQQDLAPLEITNSIVYYDETMGAAETLDMFFPETYEPSTYEYCSLGRYAGATLAAITIQSNKTFYVTGARIEGLLYYLSEVGGSPAGNGWVQYSYYNIADPSAGHDVLDPIALSVSFDPDGNNGLNVVEVPAGGQTVFEIGFGTKISYWTYTDADRNTVPFPTDNDEVIQLRGSLFLEGYLADGTEFSGAFPPPLALEMQIYHTAY